MAITSFLPPIPPSRALCPARRLTSGRLSHAGVSPTLGQFCHLHLISVSLHAAPLLTHGGGFAPAAAPRSSSLHPGTHWQPVASCGHRHGAGWYEQDAPGLQNTLQGDVLITSSFYSNSPEKSHQRGRDDSVSYRHFTHPDILAYENLLHIKHDL